MRMHVSPAATIALAALIALAGAAFVGCDRGKKASAEPPPYAEVGLLAPDFTLPYFGTSTRLGLKDLRGKVVLINFWASWCPPCRQEMPDLISLSRDYERRGVVVLGVVLNSNPQEVDQLIQQYQIPYQSVMGTDEVAGAWRVEGIPATYIIDREGIVRNHYVGAQSRTTFEWDVMQLLTR